MAHGHGSRPLGRVVVQRRQCQDSSRAAPGEVPSPRPRPSAGPRASRRSAALRDKPNHRTLEIGRQAHRDCRRGTSILPRSAATSIPDSGRLASPKHARATVCTALRAPQGCDGGRFIGPSGRSSVNAAERAARGTPGLRRPCPLRPRPPIATSRVIALQDGRRIARQIETGAVPATASEAGPEMDQDDRFPARRSSPPGLHRHAAEPERPRPADPAARETALTGLQLPSSQKSSVI